ncbi:MAG: Glu-tRNA(Gln) amidotransferase subunit GatE [Candidatus Hadarchaeum sp.]|uniref:Glu-tRNA(Gln) amidotransferase subunit GatE n=1 Tax=Candidatus Hadarchaeum sp. TaxID=2883567 RepID=UPI003D0C06F1
MGKTDIDYRGIGLRVGFEIHQELETSKLFCSCPSRLRDDVPRLQVRRRLRPTQSELGEVDRAALAEAIKGKAFNYQVYPDTVCLVELDEEPPHPVNEEALDIALEVALLLEASPVDEVHVMRKIVIDGSNTCGFQRTMLVATDGSLMIDGRKIDIPTICLEEDAARKVGENGEVVEYRLDRLGIPLIEIATGPDFTDPENPAKAALYIGQLLRATGRVKRGLGTIRQDINISIAGGARQEIKGVQELGLITTVIEREVQRQLALLEIREELKRRGARGAEKRIVEVTEFFSKTGSKLIQRALAAGGSVLALKLEKFAGLLGRELQPGRRFGTELSDRAKTYGKVGGIFHTDELPGYGISAEEVAQVRQKLGAGELDAVVLVAERREKAVAALEAVADRANEALAGVPEETRRALEDGNTEFMRPLPGASRMYPETDIPPIPITRTRIKKIRGQLPELPERTRGRLVEKYRLSQNLAERLSLSENLSLFEELVAETNADPTLVAATLEETLVSLRREGIKVEGITKELLLEMFRWVADGKLAKEAVPEVLRLAAQGLGVPEAVERLGLSRLSPEELERLVAATVAENRKLVQERGMNAVDPLMGLLMAKVRGRADGRLVHELLRKEIENFLNT